MHDLLPDAPPHLVHFDVTAPRQSPEPCLGTRWDVEELKVLARAELARLGPDASPVLREVLLGLIEDENTSV